MTQLDPVLARMLQVAVACGIPPAMALRVALDFVAPRSVADAHRLVHDAGPVLSSLEASQARLPASLDTLEPALRVVPEIAAMRLEVGDHELRGRLVFRELLRERTFFQVAAWAIAGIDLSAGDAALLEQLGINTQLADVRIWPLALTRRVAARRGFVAGVLSGLTVALNPNMGPVPVGRFMEAMDRFDAGRAEGRSLEAQLDEVVRAKERLPGVGRPVIRIDERNAQVFALVREHGREQGASWQLALAIDRFFEEQKGVRINAAGLQGAVMRDMGFSPAAATALCVLYFAVPILAQAVVAEEQLRDRKSTGKARVA